MNEQPKLRPLPPAEDIPIERLGKVVVQVAHLAAGFAQMLDDAGMRVRPGNAKQVRGFKTFIYNELYEEMSQDGYTDGEISSAANMLFETMMMLAAPSGQRPQ